MSWKLWNRFELTISRYNKIEHEEVQYEKTGVNIEKIEKLEYEIQERLKDLKILMK